MPEENARGAGPTAPGRGTQLTGKIATVTGAARGIGRTIAMEMAANGADAAVLDICGPVSSAAVFLASDAAAMMIGAEYEVTGGDSAHSV